LEKIDFQRVLDYSVEASEKGKVFIRSYETSSKTGENVEKLFTDVVRDYLDDPRSSVTESDQTLKIEEPSKEKMRKRKCCDIH
jgi:GTPase SAR1 family protein